MSIKQYNIYVGNRNFPLPALMTFFSDSAVSIVLRDYCIEGWGNSIDEAREDLAIRMNEMVENSYQLPPRSIRLTRGEQTSDLYILDMSESLLQFLRGSKNEN